MLGGTGSETTNRFSPTCYPERLEAGTLNLPAICALSEGINYVSKNFDSLIYHLSTATEYLIDGLRTVKGVELYSDVNPAGIVSFSISGISSAEVADVLNSEYDVAVRGGLHCAPLAHKHLNTLENGLVRSSLSVQNSSSEISYFIKAVKEIATRVGASLKK
jgi:selenocysteine lyase/cysteine desulfurase